MDALWGIADHVLTEGEAGRLTRGEAFLLACAFYLHDIGMAYAATPEGLASLQASAAYQSFMSRTEDSPLDLPTRQAGALAYATRTLHAKAAAELATQAVPGTSIYLFESPSVRSKWAETCGRIASSHHWPLETVERELGSAGHVPLPDGRGGDLGYVASILRLADYAHINRDRASTIDRAFRPPIEQDSLVHWLAQENVDGPVRDGADLVYRAAGPIADVDAWWLYYEMLKGLDEEIRTVRRYLDRRTSSYGRLSLQGVRGATSPEEIAAFVPSTGFLPIEINLRTGSIERLVQLLAGESLYGPDPMVAVREMIQNASDAVGLKAAMASTAFDKAGLSIPIRLALTTKGDRPILEITDPGVGMTRKVMTDFLISIASDYWSTQFHTDFPGARDRGFRPAGKFGIGFLSVFMLGDNISVESNRDGGERYHLNLRGVGRRGEIRAGPPPSGSGTAVRVELRRPVLDSIQPLNRLVPIYAPMLPHAVEIAVDGQVTTLPKGWLHALDEKEFFEWVIDAISTLQARGRGRSDSGEFSYSVVRYRFLSRERGRGARWTLHRPEYRDSQTRLVSSFEGISILTLRGLSIQPITTPGFVGVIDLSTATPDVSRRRALDADVTDVLGRAKAAVAPQIVANLNALAEQGLLIDKLEFLSDCARTYGRRTLLDATLPWISFLKLPGEVYLINCSTLLERLSKASSLFVAYGTGPWTAMRKWVSSDTAPAPTEIAVVIDDTYHDRLGYQSGSEEKNGMLSELWPQFADTALFGIVVSLAAEAWQMSPDDLGRQQGWHHSGNVIWGRFSRH